MGLSLIKRIALVYLFYRSVAAASLLVHALLLRIVWLNGLKALPPLCFIRFVATIALLCYLHKTRSKEYPFYLVVGARIPRLRLFVVLLDLLLFLVLSLLINALR
ncbi:MAG: hypothetical protein QM642_06570 [Edaphocola sp.]